MRRQQDTAPDNVGSASQSGLIAGDIRVDDNNPRAVWFWIVGDNLRLTADAVSELISGLALRTAVKQEVDGRLCRSGAFAAVVTSSCGYHVGGKADLMPKSIQTIAIPAFTTFTTRYQPG